MNTAIPTSDNTNLFGKNPVFFIGNVEDVNDPQGAHRVKVRCVGYHPLEKTGEGGVSTDDLPWAQVGMPTTHPQQARVGGKHYLQPGSWVIGIFMDGEGAQKPFVLNSFNFNPKALKKDIHLDPGAEVGKVADNVPGFTQVDQNAGVSPSSATRTPGEPGKGTNAETDPSGQTVLNDVSPKPCGQPDDKSKDNVDKEGKVKKDGSKRAQGQKFAAAIADGLCGSANSARDDIAIAIEEMFPPAATRFVYNDAVWNSLSGNHIDMNGVLAQLALLICNLLKQPINSTKAVTNETDRTAAGAEQEALLDRTGFASEILAIANSIEGDLFNGIFGTSFIDILCSLIMAILQGINNGNENSSGDNSSGNIGANPNTPIQNTDAICITDTILNDIRVLTDNAITTSSAAAKSTAALDFLSISDIASILSTLMGVLQFPLTQKYSTSPGQNAAGDMSQDALLKTIGCALERTYSTWLGASAAGGGGSSEDSSSVTRFEGTSSGFGGLPASGETPDVSTLVCEDALTVTIPDPAYANTPPFAGAGGGNINTKPDGEGAVAGGTSLPSDELICAKNFIDGTPNQVVVTRRGSKYFFNNKEVESNAFPSIFIPGYKGTPIPVVDRDTGEMVAILTTCANWNPNNPAPPITIIPDDSPTGITTDNPNYDITVGGFFIANTGFEYCDPTIGIYDLDGQTYENASAKLIVKDGRIVDVDVINNGTGFKRIPKILISDNGSKCGTRGGWGAELYPIMSLVAKPNAKESPAGVQMIYCPATNQKNLLDPVKNPTQMLTDALERTVNSITN